MEWQCDCHAVICFMRYSVLELACKVYFMDVVIGAKQYTNDLVIEVQQHTAVPYCGWCGVVAWCIDLCALQR